MRTERLVLSVAGSMVVIPLLFGCAPSGRNASRVSQAPSRSPSTDSQSQSIAAARTATRDDRTDRVDLQAYWEACLKKYDVDDFSTENLISMLDSERSPIRYCSARLLGERKETSAIPRLEEALSDRLPSVQEGATVALLKMGNTKGIPVLQGFVERVSQEMEKGDDQHLVDQLDALVVLADAGEVSAIPHLRKLLKYEPSWGVRIGALRSLTKLYEKDPSVSTDIASMQNDEHPQIRKEAARFLLRAETRE